ncbi:hypothetical protein T492DRAFT_882073, partial [Pavlovales sp. CCMP2436]
MRPVFLACLLAALSTAPLLGHSGGNVTTVSFSLTTITASPECNARWARAPWLARALTAVMLELALDSAYHDARPVPAFALVFNLNDHSCVRCAPLLVPDSTFLSWRYSGIDSYSASAVGFASAGAVPAEKRVCGWAGSVNSHKSRKIFSRVAAVNPTTLESWQRRVAIGQRAQISRWACLVDLPAIGYSGRLPLLLHSGRPLLFVERRMESWYLDTRQRGALASWDHYVPVEPALTGIVESATRILTTNASQAVAMAGRARALARRTLSLRTAVRYLMLQLLSAAWAPGLPPLAERLEAAAGGGDARAAAAARGVLPAADAIDEVAGSTFVQLVERFPHLIGPIEAKLNTVKPIRGIVIGAFGE